MSFLLAWINRRAFLLWAAPLLVGSVLLWQRLSLVEPTECVSAQPPAANGGPPAGVSIEEWEAAREEFAGLTDSTFHCSVEEMPAYWRLLKWCVRQSAADSEPNRFLRVAFHDLVNRPGTLRGAPVQVDLHVCRVVSYAAPENSLGIEQLYEIWGWSEDSRGSLYVAVTPELPSGMSVGESVSERATVCGYFYKIQGYLAASSASQSSPSAAPLIIGRLIPWRVPVTSFAKSNELWFTAAGLLLAASFIGLLSQRPALVRRRREHLAPNATAKLESWLDSNPIAAEGA